MKTRIKPMAPTNIVCAYDSRAKKPSKKIIMVTDGENNSHSMLDMLYLNSQAFY